MRPWTPLLQEKIQVLYLPPHHHCASSLSMITEANVSKHMHTLGMQA